MPPLCQALSFWDTVMNKTKPLSWWSLHSVSLKFLYWETTYSQKGELKDKVKGNFKMLLNALNALILNFFNFNF